MSTITSRNLKLAPSDVETLRRSLNRHEPHGQASTEDICPECEAVLTFAELVERYCARCGSIDPVEVGR